MTNFLPKQIFGLVVIYLMGLSLAVDLQDRNFPYPDDGILQPSNYYERYRRSEYDPDEPFYQWWFFCIRDVTSDISYVLSYNTLDPVAGNNSAYYQTFGVVDHSSSPAKTYSKYEKFDFNSITIKDYFTVSVSDGNSIVYSLTPLDNDTYHLKGYMNHTENVFAYENCDKDMFVEWDLTITRIYGWYGQAPPLEEMSKDFGKGIILWNTYSHNSFVNGYIRIGDQTIQFDHSSQFRAYCDMNWGLRYPESGSNPPINYPWGWYYFNVPSTDYTQDISVIAGYGITENDFPAYSVSSAMLDMRLNSTYHVGAREVTIWDDTDFATRAVHTSNDVDLLYCNVTRNKWVTFSDVFGKALIPLQQSIYFETGHHQILMEFESSVDEYNRLLYPYKDFFFSDFEALGVKAHLRVVRDGQVIVDMWSNDGGVEYGYKVDINI